MAEEETEDLGSLHIQRVQASDAAARIARWRERLRATEEAQPKPTEEPIPGRPEAEAIQGSTLGRVAKDVARGTVESPRQILGGVSDAVSQTGQMAREFTNWLSDTVGPLANAKLVFDDEGVHFAAGEEAKDVPTILEALAPDVDPAESVTGGMVRNVSKFLAAFAATKNLPGIQGLAAGGRGAQLTSQAIRGAITDFAVFDPHEARLSDLIQKVPALQNPVTEYLASDPTDSAAEGRFKNALEGLGLGLMVDGFQAAVRTLRAARGARAASGQADVAMRQLDENVKGQKAKLTELVGDTAEPKFRVRPFEGDLEAMARDLVEGESVRGEVFINWSRINSDEDVKEVIQKLADTHQSAIKEAQRGVRSWRATRRSAEEIDAWDVLMSRKTGQPLNAEQSLAVREMWVRSGKNVRDLAQQVVEDPSDLNKIALRKSLAVHNAIQEQVIGARTETARALNAWAIPAGDNVAFAGQMENLKGLIESDRTIEDIAQRLTWLSDAGMIKEADAFVYGSALAKGAGMVRQLYYFSMLSSPHTHARNIIGNTATIPLQITERKFANLLGRALGREHVVAGEASAQLFGTQKGLRDALVITSKGRRALSLASRKMMAGDEAGAKAILEESAGEIGTGYRAALTQETGIGVGRLELPQVGAFDPERLGLGRNTPLGRVMSYLDTVTTTPMRALGAADEVFKATTFNMELNAQAFRKATLELNAGQITREQFDDRLTDLIANPTNQMRLMAETNAKVNTFTNQPLDTPTWRAAKAIQNVPVLGRLTLPFRRTPYNLATYTFSRTPLAPFVRQWRQDILAGGAQADLAWSKMMVGTGIMLAMADLALKDDITGVGPEDPRQREQWARSGWQPQSVRIGDRYVSYRSLEPISTPIGLSANVVDILRYKDWDDDDVQVDELVIASTMAIASQVLSQNYMMGVTGFIEAMQDPQRYGERWFQRLGSLVVPRGVAMIAQQMDPTVRMAEDIGDSIRRNTPGLSKDLPPMRDVWGRPIDRSSGLGGIYDFFVPSRSTEYKPEPIDAELNRLETWITRPPKRVTFDGVPVNLELYPRIYSRYVELAGNALTHTAFGAPVGLMERGAKDELNALVSGRHPMSPVYTLMTDGPDGGKQEMIRKTVDDFRRAARDQLLIEYPELRTLVEHRRAQQPGRLALQ